jgi:hypothetical protein
MIKRKIPLVLIYDTILKHMKERLTTTQKVRGPNLPKIADRDLY